jgi:2-polyprenyl-6-methoxyphenol hydroxylase-like FAD-dependent oxidoreductase
MHQHNATVKLPTTYTYCPPCPVSRPSPCCAAGQGLNQAMEDAWGLGAALAGAAALGQPQLQALQQFRQQRAQRMRTVVGFTTSIGEASYKDGGKQEEKAMTPAEFFQFVHQVEFESLGKMQQRAAAGMGA